ncbi:MAG TPA: hypothetical protein VMM18_09245 [Gemmatimonadaceae bacterium]|nr:hypothetical protein [Gemmatimonadaceae bacterium]
MTNRLLLLVLALAVAPEALSAQDASPAAPRAARDAYRDATRQPPALPSVDSLAAAAVSALPQSSEQPHVLSSLPDGTRWSRTAKWSLLAVAAGFGAYALANSREERTDRRAQMGIIGGQLTLLGSVGFFIYDLRHRASGQENIPFEQSAVREAASSGIP